MLKSETNLPCSETLVTACLNELELRLVSTPRPSSSEAAESPGERKHLEMGCSPFGEQDGFGLVFVVWEMHESLDSSCQQGFLVVESADGKGCALFQIAAHIALGCLESLTSRVSLCGYSVGSMAEEACFEES